MRKFKFLSLILLSFTLLSVTSCGDEPDGNWEKMKWNNVDNLAKDNNFYVIPDNGGTFTFECKNYIPWLSGKIIINTEYQDMFSQENWNWKEYKNDWFEVKIVDKKVIFTFDEIEDSMTGRTVEVGVTAGDIFDTFIFQQQKLQ